MTANLDTNKDALCSFRRHLSSAAADGWPQALQVVRIEPIVAWLALRVRSSNCTGMRNTPAVTGLAVALQLLVI